MGWIKYLNELFPKPPKEMTVGEERAMVSRLISRVASGHSGCCSCSDGSLRLVTGNYITAKDMDKQRKDLAAYDFLAECA